MGRWFSVAVTCLVLLTGGVTGDEEAADNHACTYFKVIDFNNDCIATYLDYVFEWLRVPILHIKGQGLLADVTRQLTIAVQALQQFPLTDKDLVQSLLTGGVKKEEFLANMKAKRKDNPEKLKSQIKNLVRFLFNVSNEEGDETKLTKKELGTIYYVFRIDESVLQQAFDDLDLDGDLSISFDEGVTAANDYFITANDDRSALFAGPVIKCEDICKKPAGCSDPIADGSSNMPTKGSLGNLSVLLNQLKILPDRSCHATQIPILGDLLDLVSGVLGTVTNLLGGLLG